MVARTVNAIQGAIMFNSDERLWIQWHMLRASSLVSQMAIHPRDRLDDETIQILGAQSNLGWSIMATVLWQRSGSVDLILDAVELPNWVRRLRVRPLLVEGWHLRQRGPWMPLVRAHWPDFAEWKGRERILFQCRIRPKGNYRRRAIAV